jgi:Anti-sigma-K factor rskA/Putative zinc-finger
VTGCPTHGALLGGYILGALEPAEMEAMRLHLESCPQCAREERKLAGLPALLDTIEPGDVPPPQLSPELEELVLDRFVREHRKPELSSARRRRRVPVLAAASGIAAALIVGLVVLLIGGDDEDAAYAWSSLKGRGPAADSRAYARLTSVDAGTQVSLQARRLPSSKEDQYELWCVREDGRWVSGGTFKSRPDGRARAELTAAVTAGNYHKIVVTTLGAGPEPGTPVMRGKLNY